MLEDKQGYDFSHRAKVIEHEGERYYHSEWVFTRDKTIERLEAEKSDLLSLIDKYKDKFDRIERLTLFYDDNVRKEVYSIAKSCLEKDCKK